MAACPQLERRREAIWILEQLPPAEADSPAVKVILAQLYLSEKNWLKGLEQLRSLATSHERESRYLALYIDQLLQHRETAEAELWLDRLDKLAPGDFSTVAFKARALVQRGEIPKAIQTLRGYRDGPVAEPATGTARLGQVAALLESLARGSAGTDSKTDSTSGTAELLAEAEKSYRAFVKREPKQTLVVASFLARRGRFDEAIDLLAGAMDSATAPRPSPRPRAISWPEGWPNRNNDSGWKSCSWLRPTNMAGRSASSWRSANFAGDKIKSTRLWRFIAKS